jgi:hypothetical protein
MALLSLGLSACGLAQPSGPRVLATPWASDLESRQVDPRKMFPLVGGVAHRNRYALDLSLGSIRMAVLQSQDLTRVKDHAALREAVSIQLDSNPDFKRVALGLCARFGASGEFEGEFDPATLTLIVEGGAVTAAFLDGSSGGWRYISDSSGNLTIAQEPPLLPLLRAEGPFIIRSDTGEPVTFRGISLPINRKERGEAGIFEYVTRNVEANESLGLFSNFIRLSAWTKNWSRVETEELPGLARYLERKGMYLVFTPHNDERAGGKGNRYLPNEKDKQTVLDVTAALKGRPNVLIGLWNEPARTDWTEWSRQIAEMHTRLMKIHPPEAMPLLMVPGILWSRDFREANIPLPPNSYAIDVHPYLIAENGLHRRVDEMWTHQIGRLPVLITELSGICPADWDLVPLQGRADLENMQRTLALVNDPGNEGMIGYAVWRGDDSAEGVRVGGGADCALTPRGALLKEDRTLHPYMEFMG